MKKQEGEILEIGKGKEGQTETKKGGLREKNRALMKGGVVPLGVEPRTHGFSVQCSTT